MVDSADKRANAEDTALDGKDTRENEREDLEKRLAEFTLNIRANAADAEKKRREATSLETRASAVNVTPPLSRAPERLEEARVVLAPGLNPQHEPTLVGRRDEQRNRWDFTKDGEIVDSLDAPEPRSTPEPIEQPPSGANAPRTERKRSVLVLVSLAAGALLGGPLLWTVLWSPEFMQPVPVRAVSTTVPPMVLSGQTNTHEPPVPQPSEDPSDTSQAPAPSNVAPMFPPNDEQAPNQHNPPPTKSSRGKPALGVKRPRRGPLGGDPEYR